MVSSSNIYGYSTDILDFSANIVDKENARLADVDTGWGTFVRNRDFQVSGNKKQSAFRWIYIIIVLLILFSGIMIVLKQNFDSIFLDIYFVLVLSIGVIYIIVLYLDITIRSPTDYDKIRPDAPTMVSPNETANRSVFGISGGMLDRTDLTTIAICKGVECCGLDFSWNSVTQKCETGPLPQSDSFSSMGPVPTNYANLKMYTSYV